MNQKSIRIYLQVIGSIVAVAWLIEAITIGKGFISTYLAPFAFGPLIIAAFMKRAEKKDSQDDGRKP